MNTCQICGEPMPEGEEMFNYHGYSGPCPKPPLPKSGARDYERYLAACHAMQSGVAHTMNLNPDGETSPKHLRVGINSAMCNEAALVRLLIAKGVITEAEHAKEIADEMEREVDRYEKRIDPSGRVKLA